MIMYVLSFALSDLILWRGLLWNCNYKGARMYAQELLIQTSVTKEEK